MSNQNEPCERVQCEINCNCEKTLLWVPEDKLVCDFVAQILSTAKQEPGTHLVVWIRESGNKVLRNDMSVTLRSIGIKNQSQNQFLVCPEPGSTWTPIEDDPEPCSEFNTADDELALGASASPTNLSAAPSPMAARMTLDLNKIDKTEVGQEYESQVSQFASGEDELGLGASASPTSNSSIPSPSRIPSPPPPPAVGNLENNKDSETPVERRWQVDSSPSTSFSRRTGYVGLVNQAMTCYLNSLLQALFMTPEFRNALYSWEYRSSSKSESKSIPYQLQKLFLNLQTSSKSAVETTELTQSFGWDSSEAWQQHDIQELCRVMFDALEQKFKGTEQANLINKLYQGKMIDYVKCLECGKEKQREDTFLDIPLSIRPFGATSAYSSIEEALRGFVKPETLDGNNQYFCEGCGKKCDAHKGLKFTHFPYLLTFHLMRFDFDPKTMHRIKLNDRVTFPEILNLDHFFEDSWINEKENLASGEKNDDNSTADSGSALDDDSCLPSVDSALPTPSQEMDQDSDEGIEVGCASNGGTKDVNGRYVYELFSIMIHSGSASGGHYYAYIKDFSSQKWFCFNDQSVSSLVPEDIEKTFGGGSTHAYYSGAYSSSTNAYMLMYRQIDKEKNTLTMTIDEFPPHLKKLYEKLEEKEKADPCAGMDYKFSTRCKVIEDTNRPEKFTYDSQKEILDTQGADCNVIGGAGDYTKNIRDRTGDRRRVFGKTMSQTGSTNGFQCTEGDTKEPVQITFFYPKNKDEFCRNPYAALNFRKDLSYEVSAPLSQLRRDVYEILHDEEADMNKNQLLLYFKKSSDKLDCLIEGEEEESLAKLLAKHGPLKKVYNVTARIPHSKLNSVLTLPGTEKLNVHRVDMMTKEVSKARRIPCSSSLTVEQFKTDVRAEFNVAENVGLIIAVEITKGMGKEEENARTYESRRSSNLDIKSTQLKFLVNDKATLKQEQVTCDSPLYVCFGSAPVRSVMEEMLRVIDSDKNSVVANFIFPDVDPVILERLSIPSLEEERSEKGNQKDSKVVEEAQTVRETSKSSDLHRLRIHLDRDTNFISPKGDSCAISIGGEGGGGGLVDPGGHAVTTCSGDGAAACAKPVCSIPILENIEEEQIHFSDQSASEESSLTDSERTIIGDVADDCPMSSASNSPDASFQLSQDLMSNSLPNIIDSSMNPQPSESNSVILSSKDCPLTSYSCKYLNGKNSNSSKQLSIDKRMPFKTLLENLEPFVGVSSQYFKIYSAGKSHEIRDEFEFMRYFQTENLFAIRLEPILKHNQVKAKIYFLPAEIGPNSEIEFLFEWIIKKGESVAETKRAMVAEYARIRHIDKPVETLNSLLRLRKKTSELSRICLDNELMDEDFSLLRHDMFILQELEKGEIKENANQMAVYVRRWYPSKHAQGEVYEIVLEEDATRTMLIQQIEKISDIPAEHIDVARSPFMFPQSLYSCKPGDSIACDNDFGEPQWGDSEEDLKESRLRIGGDGTVLLFMDKREEARKCYMNYNKSDEISVPLPLNSAFTSRYGSTQDQEQLKSRDMLESFNAQKAKRRTVSRKEKGLKIHLGSSPVNSTLNCEMEE